MFLNQSTNYSIPIYQKISDETESFLEFDLKELLQYENKVTATFLLVICNWICSKSSYVCSKFNKNREVFLKCKETSFRSLLKCIIHIYQYIQNFIKLILTDNSCRCQAFLSLFIILYCLLTRPRKLCRNKFTILVYTMYNIFKNESIIILQPRIVY